MRFETPFEENAYIDVSDVVQGAHTHIGIPDHISHDRQQKLSILMISAQVGMEQTAEEQTRLAIFTSTPEVTPAELFGKVASPEQVAATITRVVTHNAQISRAKDQILCSLTQQHAVALPLEAYIAGINEMRTVMDGHRADAYASLAVLALQYSPDSAEDAQFIDQVNDYLTVAMDWSDAAEKPIIAQTPAEPLSYAGTDAPRYFVEIIKPVDKAFTAFRGDIPS